MERNKEKIFLSSTSAEKRDHLLKIPHYLINSKQVHRLNKVLTDFSFLQTKISRTGAQALISDYDYFLENSHQALCSLGEADLNTLKILRDTLKLSSPALEINSNQLTSQLLGRLQNQNNETINNLLKTARKSLSEEIWLRPVSSSLTPPQSKIIRIFDKHSGKIECISVFKDGKTAVSSDSSGKLIAWTPSTCEQIWSSEKLRCLKLTSDQKHVVLASYDNIIRILDLKTGNQVHELDHGHQGINEIAMSPDDSIVFLACKDGVIRLIDLWNGKTVCCLNNHDEVSCIAVSFDGKKLVSGSGKNNIITLWDLVSGRKLHGLRGHTLYIRAVAFSKNGRFVVSGSWDNNVIIWDAVVGEKKHVLKGHRNFVETVIVVNDSKVFSGSWDKNIIAWDLETGKELYTLKGHADWVNSLAVTANGKHLISGSSDQTIRIWDIE